MHIVVGNHDLSVNLRIEQNIEIVDGTKKRYRFIYCGIHRVHIFVRIIKLLESIMDGSKMLIFCQTKRGTDSLASMLGTYGLSAIAIHGDKTQGVTIAPPFFSTFLAKRLHYASV